MNDMETELKTQLGISSEIDLSLFNWTFQMPKNFNAQSGTFAIIPEGKQLEIIRIVKMLKGSFMAHPDCEPNSEFADMVDSCDEIISILTPVSQAIDNNS